MSLRLEEGIDKSGYKQTDQIASPSLGQRCHKPICVDDHDHVSRERFHVLGPPRPTIPFIRYNFICLRYICEHAVVLFTEIATDFRCAPFCFWLKHHMWCELQLEPFGKSLMPAQQMPRIADAVRLLQYGGRVHDQSVPVVETIICDFEMRPRNENTWTRTCCTIARSRDHGVRRARRFLFTFDLFFICTF